MPRIPGRSKLQDTCISAITEASGDLLKPYQAEALLKGIAARLANTAQHTFASMDDIVRQAMMEASEKNILMAKVEQVNALKGVQIARRIITKVEATGQLYGKALSSYLHDTINSKILGVRGELLANFDEQLVAKDLEREFMTNAHEKDVFTELYNIREINKMASGPTVAGTGKGVTQNERAFGIAQTVYGTQETIRARKNRAGTLIPHDEHFVVEEAFDPDRMRRATGKFGLTKESIKEAREAFVADFMQWVDLNKTFPHLLTEEQAAKELAQFWDERVLHIGKPEDPKADPIAEMNKSFQNIGSLAKKMSIPSKFKYKNADVAYNAFKKYGTGDLQQAVMHSIKKDSHHIVLLENLGPNPEKQMKRLLKYFTKKASEQENADEHLSSLRPRFNPEWLMNSYRTLAGENDQPASHTIHSITRALLAVTTSARAGMMGLQGLTTDRAFQHLAAKSQGISGMTNFNRSMRNLLPHSETDKKTLRKMGLGIEGWVGQMLVEWSDMSPTIHSKLFKMQQLVFKYSGATYMNEHNKGGFGIMTANNLGDAADQFLDGNAKFSDLNPDLVATLKQYDIGPREFRLIAETRWKDENGRTFITPDTLASVPKEKWQAYMKSFSVEKDTPTTEAIPLDPLNESDVARVQDDIRTRMYAFFVDQSERSLATAQSREKALLNFGTRAGTPEGAVARLFAQFKSFPIAAYNNVLKRELKSKDMSRYQGVDKFLHSKVYRLTELAVTTTIAGYALLSIQALLKGKTPPQLKNDDGSWNFDVMMEAASKGGGAGIMGDLFLTEYNRSSAEIAKNWLGPSLGAIADVSAAAGKAVTAPFSDQPGKAMGKATANSMKTLLNNTPFMNMILLRTGLDYMFLWSLEETLNPGAMQRKEQLAEENSQGYWLSPVERTQ